MKIKDITDLLTTPAIEIENTVDKLLFGDPYTKVNGIAVTFLATQEAIEKAITLGANLIISHEGIFYSHRSLLSSLNQDPIYLKKCQTIEENNIAIFRYHDYIHRFMPDGITAGLVNALDWKQYEIENLTTSSIIETPPTTLENTILHIKNKLKLDHLRFIGDLSMTCKRIGVSVGYRGSGEMNIPLYLEKSLDLMICGEGPEWETPEYIRDAVRQGRCKALIVLGHAESEMPGMKYLAQSLQARLSDIPVHFIAQDSVFKIH